MKKLFLAKELTLINIPLFLIILFLLRYSSCHPLDRITSTKPLKKGDVLLSDGATFALGFFTLSKSSNNHFIGIWYNEVSEQTVVWVANRNNPLNDTTSGVFSIDIHGNIVLVVNHKNNRNPIWSSNVSLSSSPTKTFVKLLDTGNLVLIEDRTKKFLWQSFDYPCDTVLPLMKLGLDKKTGLNRFLSSSKSPNDPRLGNMSYKIDPRGYPQFFVYKNEDPIYRVGSWTGQRWGGVPEMIPNYFIFNVSFIDDASEMSVIYTLTDPSALSRMVLDNTGHLSRYTWQPDGRRWELILRVPRANCDLFRRCGSNSYCDSSYSADKFQCVCLPGFEESKNPGMSNGSGTGGCARKKNVSTCQSGEGFVKVPHVKLPDTSKVHLDKKSISLSLKECEEKCLKDCSCEAYASANEVTQIGCLTWHADMEDIRIFENVGQDLYVRVDAVELAKYESKPHHSLSKKWMVTLLVVSVCLLMLVITSVYWFAKKKKQARRKLDHLVDRGKDSDLSLFNLNDIIAATENFSDANKLGRGGFGSVYKGLLQNGMTIAVKRLSKHSGERIEDFKNEVTVMAKLQHRNLVRILGCCIEGKEKMLIYEYLPNKSLDTFIFDQAKKLQLDWGKRFDIICGIARGILYLHHDSRLRIIHRDLKASNVLLDSALNPKLSDFGMARIFSGDKIEASTNNVVGTYGYMSPEYAMEGLFSIKSDVYSFGVLLLEIVTGRKCSSRYDDITCTLVGHIWELWREGRAMDIVDPSLRGEASLEQVMKCINIGLLCVQDYATERPTMLEVISMLENDIRVLPPPKQPGFMFKKTTCDQSAYPCAGCTEEFNSLNGMSTTEVGAR